MKKLLVISLILFLVLFTAFIKNSTKRIDDEIFVIKENLRSLKKDLGNLMLEYNYLSSGKKLMEFQSKFFDKDLETVNTSKIQILVREKEKTIIKNLEIKSE